jgi:hypothetical protein
MSLRGPTPTAGARPSVAPARAGTDRAGDRAIGTQGA